MIRFKQRQLHERPSAFRLSYVCLAQRRKKDLIKLTNRMLDELGSTHCADTIIGGPLLKGISGGERKCTSVGVELVPYKNLETDAARKRRT